MSKTSINTPNGQQVSKKQKTGEDSKKQKIGTEAFKKGKQQWADHLTQKAKHDNYPARSVYKLMEIQKKFSIMKKGNKVLDLGCAPGSWLIYAAQTIGQGAEKNVGNTGAAVGIDLQKVTVPLPSNATAIQGDIFDFNQDNHLSDLHDSLAQNMEKGYDVVLSDMAPATTGRKDIDTSRSFQLCEAALKVACERLVNGGNFVCKIFQGADFKQFEQSIKASFKQYAIFKPDSCRKASKEIYIIGKGKI
ncbi:MAG: RlmE family RNA methyltransferase [Desulfamplus sp.]|nr:RlmE family RNA methyltransferase [Desulfamplus sp.]